MNLFTPAEVAQNTARAAVAKAGKPAWALLLSGALAGAAIAFGAAAANTAAHALENVSAARLVMGLLFPFGLGIVLLTGTELFTGNCLMPVAVLDGLVPPARVLRNWALVYLGNFAGAAGVAWACASSGQFGYSSGGLAAFTVRVASAKCALAFGDAFWLGVLCNALVCLGVLCASTAKGTAGRVVGAYLPVAFFVISGFEHSVANMYYVPAGILAARAARYAAAVGAGLGAGAPTWPSFLARNLLPVTLGNIVGGVAVGVAFRAVAKGSAREAP